jgi:GT2 family glycosyltransferase
MKIALVILNWNGKPLLEKFLEGIIQKSPEAEVIIGDNASTDDSIDFLRTNFPNIRIIQNDRNYGFAGGYNRILEQVEADYYILLNSDIEVSDNWINPVITLMERDKRIAACQPKIRSYHDKTKFEYAGAAGGYIDWLGYPFCRGRVFDTIEEDKGQYEDDKQVFWATGAALFVKTDAFRKAGGFDEDFFAHQEEIDLCWRLQRDGYTIYCCPTSTVYHIGGGSLPKSSPQKNYLNFRNNLYMLYKNLPASEFYMILVLRLFLDSVAFFKILIGDGLKNALSVIRAYIDFFKNMNKMKVKRCKEEVYVNTIFPKSLLWEYYFRSRKFFSDLKI